MRQRHALRRRKDSKQNVNLFLVDQAFGFVDRCLDLALRIDIDRLDGVAIDAAAGIEHFDRVLGPKVARVGAGRGHGPSQVVQHANTHLFAGGLGCGQASAAGEA